MKVIIAGSRDITDKYTVIDAVKGAEFVISEVVSGVARGVDTLGEQWAEKNNIPVKQFPADWETFGRSAGYQRNYEMARYADALIAIWDGKSRGTLNMINSMVNLKKPVYVYCP